MTITKTKQQTNDTDDGKGDSSIHKLHQREGGAQWAKLEGQAVKLDVTLHCEDFG